MGDHISVSDRRKQEATRLGLQWPLRGGTRRVGRPARQDVWEAAVSQALRENRFDEVSLLCDRQVPEWYRGGRAVLQPTESVDVAHKVLHAEAGEETLHAKRRRVTFPSHVQKWLWSGRMRAMAGACKLVSARRRACAQSCSRASTRTASTAGKHGKPFKASIAKVLCEGVLREDGLPLKLHTHFWKGPDCRTERPAKRRPSGIQTNRRKLSPNCCGPAWCTPCPSTWFLGLVSSTSTKRQYAMFRFLSTDGS